METSDGRGGPNHHGFEVGFIGLVGSFAFSLLTGQPSLVNSLNNLGKFMLTATVVGYIVGSRIPKKDID